VLFERVETPGLAHYSYIVGCQAACEIAVVDPKRDVDTYLEYAASQGLRIAHVLETHIHADYASGARALAQRSGAQLWLSAYDSGEIFEVSFPHRETRDGDVIALGGIKIQASHTPGHTPEHLSFLVYDTNRSKHVPMLMLSGDFLFVGSLGRPDLLGEEAKRGLAKALFHSARTKLAALPDGLEIHPGHGAGSMCGAGMDGRPSSTLGFERIANPYIDPGLTSKAFVEKVLGSVPPFPAYYKRMKQVNSKGALHPPALDGVPALDVRSFKQLLDGGAVAVDLRDQLGFGTGHIPNSFGIGGAGNLSTWASWVVPYERPLLLVGDSAAQMEHAVRALVRVGLDDVRGHLQGGIQAWTQAGYPLVKLPQFSPQQLHDKLRTGASLPVLDVRSDEEWKAGHIKGAVHLFGGTLQEHVQEIPQHPLVLVCGSGYRSTVIAGVLERHGFTNLINMTGGMNAWYQAGLPTQT